MIDRLKPPLELVVILVVLLITPRGNVHIMIEMIIFQSLSDYILLKLVL